MSQPELLKRVVQALESAGIEYMVTGSIASSLLGFPRATHDIDFVIDIDVPAVSNLAAAFPQSAFYLDEAAAVNAVGRKEMFNLIEVESGIKVDFWPLTDEPFDRVRFARRLTEQIAGLQIKVSSPEDTILMKLKWGKMSGGSEKQFVDALRIFEVQYSRLDMEYLRKWADGLDVMDALARLFNEANPE